MEELNDIVSKIIECWKKKRIPQMFFPDIANNKLYEDTVKLFVAKYPLTYEILDFIVKCVMNDDEEIDPVYFLFSLRERIYDEENSFCIVRYIFEKFNAKEIEKYSYFLYMREKIPSSEKIWFDYVKLLYDYKYDTIRLFHQDYDPNTGRTKILLQNYFCQCEKINLLEEENYHMKKKIDEMELHIKYMPGGEGYLETKKHFESFHKKV